jgi:hypothetical protein
MNRFAIGLALLATAAVMAAGCRDGGTSTTDPMAVGTALEPDEVLYRHIVSGKERINAALASMEAAYRGTLQIVDEVPPGYREHLLELTDLLDSAGAHLSEFAAPAPPRERFATDFARLDERRILAIESCNLGLRDLREAQDAVEAMLEHPEAPAREALTDLRQRLAEAVLATEGAIQALGGEVRPPTSDALED